jgi:ABC-type sulfate transport system permease component
MPKFKIIGASIFIIGFISLVVSLLLFKDCQIQSPLIDSVIKLLCDFSIPAIIIGLALLILTTKDKKI